MAITSIMIALMICGLATFVAADDLENTRKARFNLWDLNKDGVLTLEETLASFDKRDTNNDGALTVFEYSGTPTDEKVLGYFKRDFKVRDQLDGKVDGLIQKSSLQEIFRLVDVDGDGQVNLKEMIGDLKKHLGETK